jgi:hypothetical protein
MPPETVRRLEATRRSQVEAGEDTRGGGGILGAFLVDLITHCCGA